MAEQVSVEQDVESVSKSYLRMFSGSLGSVLSKADSIFQGWDSTLSFLFIMMWLAPTGGGGGQYTLQCKTHFLTVLHL